MARGQNPVEPEASRSDPTITSKVTGPEYPEGTHPARSPVDVTHSVEKIDYRENPDKPDKTSVAQLADIPEGWPGSTP
jgi:hypothetical protein